MQNLTDSVLVLVLVLRNEADETDAGLADDNWTTVVASHTTY